MHRSERTGDAGSIPAASTFGSTSDDLLEELRALALRLRMVAVTWTMAEQAATALRDAEVLACATESAADAASEADWFLTRV